MLNIIYFIYLGGGGYDFLTFPVVGVMVFYMYN